MSDRNEPAPSGPVLAPLAIVGPTASGKTSLALSLARRAIDEGVAVEIVSADAMALYRGMDVGTAKPSGAERSLVPHHLIDLADPSEAFTVGRFKAAADQVLDDCSARGVTPLVVGGTGLYVQSIVDDLQMPGQFPEVAAQLASEPDTVANTLVLWRRLEALDPIGAAKMEPTNRRRILRALEVCLGSGRPFSEFGPGMDAYPPTRFVLVGIEIDRQLMDQRIDDRYDDQMVAGFLDEVRAIEADGGGFGTTAGQGLGYRELRSHLRGEIDLATALDEAKRRTHRFARRQQRWFRRDPRITWFEAAENDGAAQRLSDVVWEKWMGSPRSDLRDWPS